MAMGAHALRPTMAKGSDQGLGYYVLDETHRVVPATHTEWAAMFEDIDSRRVGHDTVGDVSVSTVFLGMDHGFGRMPELFETMTFGGTCDQILVARYPTWESAARGHRVTVTRLRAGYHPVP